MKDDELYTTMKLYFKHKKGEGALAELVQFCEEDEMPLFIKNTIIIVYEGRYHNKIVSSPERKEQAILNLRVAVTRAKEHTYILTPDDEPCLLL